jgi:23S rRNA (guanosine2251-2'-O)-methyltransferase
LNPETDRSSRADVLAGRRPVLELLRAQKQAQEIRISKEAGRSHLLSEIRSLARIASIPVKDVPARELDDFARGINHQGVAALTSRYRYTPLDDLLGQSPSSLLLLDGVMDPHNLGSLLRSADGAGFEGVIIPSHGAAGVTATVRRVSAGAAEIVPVVKETNMSRSLEAAKGAGLWMVGLDAAADEDLWSSHLMDPPVGLVLGSEDRGLSRGVRDKCDGLVRIPGAGRLQSLNVAVAGALAMFEVARRKASSAKV